MKRIKQMLALILCVCMIVTVWPVGATQAADAQDVTSYSLNEMKKTVFSSDYFSSEEKYKTALGSFSGHGSAIPWAENGLISTGDIQRNAIFRGVSYEYVSGMQNYTVSADVETTQTSGNVAVMVHSQHTNATQAHSSGYEFNILGSGQKFRLNRRINGTVYTFAPTKGQNGIGKPVTEFFPSYTAGQKITMSISATTNAAGNIVLNCYATFNGETKPIFENIIDDTTSKITSGAPGIKINKENATVTRVAVTNEAGATIFENTFSTESNYKTAMGNFADHSKAIKWTDAGLVSDSVERNAFFYGALQQCTTTADVVTTQTTGNVALMVFSQNANNNDANSYGYEFNILGSGQKFRLNRRIGGTVYTFAPIKGNNGAGKPVTDFFPSYESGDKITLSITGAVNAEGNVVLNCYATFEGVTKTIFENIVDNTNLKITCGSPGIKINKENATVSNVSVSVEEKVPNLLYEDSFDNATSYVEAYGDYSRGTKFIREQSYLTTGSSRDYETKFNGISSANPLENYTVSADMSFGFGTGKFLSLTAYGAKDTGYEFGLINDSTKGQAFRLYRRGANTAQSAVIGYPVAISEFFTAEDGTFIGDVFELSMKAQTESTGVRINCFATYNGETKLIFNDIVDTSDNKFTSGVPGIRCNDNVSETKAKVDNICVKKLVDVTPEPSPEPTPDPTPDPEPALSISLPYEDKFSEDANTLKKKWSADANVSFENGTAVLNGTSMYLTAADDLSKWHTYVCEAEVTMTTVVVKEQKTQTAGVVVAANPNPSGVYQGYEVTIYHENGVYSVRIYDRATGAKQLQEIDSYTMGDTATMKVEISGNKINCYVNDKAVITGYTVSEVEQLSGTVGFISGGNQAIVDDLSVKAYVPYTEECKLPFAEQFDNEKSIQYRWNNGAMLTVQDEKAFLDNDTTRNTYLTAFEEAYDWSNYVYEADVTLTDDVIKTQKTQTAAIVAAANNQNKGYEFGFFVEDGVYQVRLYDRIQGKSLAMTEWYCELNESYKLSMIVSKNAIQCYVDGELILEEWIEAVSELQGTIGMCASGNVAVFDNLKVETFTGEIKQKKVQAPVADKNGVYYSDTFDTGIYLNDNKWPSSVLDISEGKAKVSGTKGILYLTGDESYLLLKDYVVEAKVTVSSEKEASYNNTMGAIVARTNGEKTGYEFGIVCAEDDVYARLYDRTTGTILAKNSDIALDADKEYLLTMICEGNVITCYVDGVCVFTVTDNTNKSGTAGFRTVGTVYYDNLVVADTTYAIKKVVYSPATGDDNVHILFWGIMMMAMVVVCGFTLRYKKSKCSVK